jgi:hypothetical protein
VSEEVLGIVGPNLKVETPRLVFSQSFYPSTSKNLELKGKKKLQPVPKPVISKTTHP